MSERARIESVVAQALRDTSAVRSHDVVANIVVGRLAHLGYRIVELPTPAEPGVWPAPPGFRNPVELIDVERYPIRHSGEVVTNAEGARSLAARLLAATAAVEGRSL
ncbi:MULTISPECIES: hypothetical protein [Nocardiaceae]|uniref:hypothetical protein n=1 Tax=Nocardiaceae TaxID=85025 RepID=UPI00070D622F|nr:MULTISPECIES: hypothetical protein [Rhodococcus]KQU35662.1 hypothetical protein ASH04_23595 [Rhodococcus sp. Leaf233]MBP2527522.1 hypothetical protein [Rhodococcus sp. PvP104]WQH31269.1 hypothetical protein U2G91_26040 [Rhodococcus fascians]